MEEYIDRALKLLTIASHMGSEILKDVYIREANKLLEAYDNQEVYHAE